MKLDMHFYEKSMICLIMMWASTSYAGKSIEYYNANIDKAKVINDKCTDEIKEAVSKGDEDKLKSIYEDGDCHNAKKAIKQYDLFIVKSTRSQEFVSEEHKYIDKYKNLDITIYMDEEIGCLRTNSDSPKCSAFYKILPSRKNEYMAYINNKSDDDITIYVNDVCNKNTTSSVACEYVTEVKDKREVERLKISIENMSYTEYFQKESDCDDPRSIRCEYLKDILGNKKNSYILNRIASGNHSELYEEKDEVCDKGNGTLCKLHRKINRKLLEDSIAIYLTNNNRLKNDLSECLDKIQHYENEKNNEKRREVKNSLMCKSVFKASKKISN